MPKTTKDTISTALAKANGTKFTLADKKLVIDAIKVRYNTMLQAISNGLSRASAALKPPPAFPIQLYGGDQALYRASLNPTKAAAFDKLLASIETYRKEHNKLIEAYSRTLNALREEANEMLGKLNAERDDLIFQVSLLGSSADAASIINSLRTPEGIVDEMRTKGIEVSIDALQAGGIGRAPKK